MKRFKRETVEEATKRLEQAHMLGRHQKPVFGCPACIWERGATSTPNKHEGVIRQCEQVVVVAKELIEQIYEGKPKFVQKLCPFAERLDDELSKLEEVLKDG